MTDTLTQRARDVAGRLKAILDPGFTMKRVSEGHYRGTNNIYRNPDGPKAAAIISELVERIEVMRDALGNIARDSNPDWTENRVYPQDVLDEVNRMAVEAYYAPPSVLGKQEGEG